MWQSHFLDTPHGSSQGMLRLRTFQRTTVAPDGPARPDWYSFGVEDLEGHEGE
jgi:hypothetical protein